EAQFAESRGTTLAELLARFETARRESLGALRAMNLTPADLERTGTHPELGTVTLGQLLATWTVHDLDHVGQIARTMAKEYRAAVGPWKAYLSILSDREPPERPTGG
ncbi:MAG TPA: DinB family protein, partial [Thermoanaerobaculia bacterium]|nr:DinB family protein [Thermoanaerobaculia bacterium]